MFNFFKKKGGKGDTADALRKQPSADGRSPVAARAPRTCDITNDKPKDVVNLLIPETDYTQKTGVGAILQIMAGKRRRGKRKRTDSCRVSPPKETHTLQRSKSVCDVPAKNTLDAPRADDSDFVRALVLQKYANKTTPTQSNQHVSCVYVSDETHLEEKRTAEALLREIARTIDCTVDELEETQMGATDSKADSKSEPFYESIADNESIDSYKEDLKGELEKLLKVEAPICSREGSPNVNKKSNLKPPRSDNEGCSDDDRSDCGKKRVTFRKRIIFDDGEEQTDEEVGSSFESLTSEEEEEYLEDANNFECDNKTVINVTDENSPITIKRESIDDGKKLSSDNSDSGFIEISEKNESDEVTSNSKTLVESESECEEEIIEEIIEEEIEEEEIEEYEEIEETESESENEEKSLVSKDSRLQSQVAALTGLAEARCGEVDHARDLLAQYCKEIETRRQEIEQLKCELAAAYKESELVRQRSRSLEEELAAARSCSADLADQLHRRNDESLRQLKAEIEDVHAQRAELESRVLALERDKNRLEQEKLIQEQKAQEALTAAEANTVKWRAAHEAARSQASARAERMLADCEWKMRELEKRARDAERQNSELTEEVATLKKSQQNPAHEAELQQLRGLFSEQQRSVQSLTLQLQKTETREEALKLEVHRLKDLLEREIRSTKEKEERYMTATERLQQEQTKMIETLKAEHSSYIATMRATLERVHAERTRAAIAQLRETTEQDAKVAERKLREMTIKVENLKEVLSTKETQFDKAISEARSKADWDLMQLRHLLDRADIAHANSVEAANEQAEKERERLIEEWSQKLKEVEERAAIEADEARRLLDATQLQMKAERLDQLNKMKEKHRQEMDEQWENFMTDKENCLSRMKMECTQEGEEDRVKREKELLEEIAELKAQIQSKSCDYNDLAMKTAACGRTLTVTEEELKEALARERELREKRSDDAAKIKQVERASKDQIEHLTRKCACLRKLFDDMRTRLTAKERIAEQESKAKDKELHQLRGEVARLTKILVEQSSPKLGTRTRADGCETVQIDECKTATAPDPPRRKGGTLRTPEPIRRRPTCPLPELPPVASPSVENSKDGRPRAKSVDLPAVQVPIRIKQLEGKTKN